MESAKKLTSIMSFAFSYVNFTLIHTFLTNGIEIGKEPTQSEHYIILNTIPLRIVFKYFFTNHSL